jgi:hypothetical protein
MAMDKKTARGTLRRGLPVSSASAAEFSQPMNRYAATVRRDLRGKRASRSGLARVIPADGARRAADLVGNPPSI